MKQCGLVWNFTIGSEWLKIFPVMFVSLSLCLTKKFFLIDLTSCHPFERATVFHT